MKLTSLSGPRLIKALARAGTFTVDAITICELRDLLLRRGMPERDLHRLFFEMINVLEPPSCDMTHCGHFGGAASSMNCILDRVPGRCPIHKQYKQRQAKREAKAAAAAEPKDAA